MKKSPLILFVCFTLILLSISAVSAQRKSKPRQTVKPGKIVFAVVNDGTTLEPIGLIDKGTLIETTGGDAEPKALANFAAGYYKPQTAYKLIFGGASAGTVTVKSSDAKAECGKNLGSAVTVSPKAKIKGLVMALATNDTVTKKSGMRRMPTAAERAEIETLVRAEFTKQNVSANAQKNLHYYNLTAVDIDSDGKAEMVGTYWVDSSAKEKNVVFFIADKDSSGKYSFGYSDYKKITPEEVMSGEMKDLDTGVYSELLLDTFEYNGDNSDEIFTVTQGFEGSSFTVYSRNDGKWTKVFEGANYHCAY